jgi:DNA-binding protein H-NS
MRTHDISIGDLGVKPGRKVSKANGASPLKGRKAKAIYRDPKTGETWSGRGRTARWLAAAERAGRKRAEFLIKKS